MKKNQSSLVFLILFFSILLLQSLSEKSNELCVSPGGRFLPFKSQGKPPKRVRELTLCRVFKSRTCCDVSHTHSAFLSIRRLASTGEANQECLDLWELLECSICDPNIGVKPGPPLVCASFCDRLYQSCYGAYFSMDAITQVLSPCGVGDFVCGRTSEWISNGTELCQAAGFSVTQLGGSGITIEDRSCYGGKASLDSITDLWKSKQSGTFSEDERLGLMEEISHWVSEMPFIERLSWVVGGSVLTAWLFFTSRRRSNNQREKQAVIIRAARAKRFETQASPRSTVVGNKKGGAR